MNRRHPYSWLLAGLILLLVLGPLLSSTGLGWVFLSHVALGSCLIVGVWSLAADRKQLHRGIGIVALALVAATVAIATGSRGAATIALAVDLAFFIFSFQIVMRDVLFDRVVDANKIVGAACAYLLLGMSWAVVYAMVLVWEPESLRGLTAEGGTRFSEILYFSFVTLTTLGYGEITPVDPLVRVIAILEAVVGPFYLAVVIASLVAMLVGRSDAADVEGTRLSD